MGKGGGKQSALNHVHLKHTFSWIIRGDQLVCMVRLTGGCSVRLCCDDFHHACWPYSITHHTGTHVPAVRIVIWFLSKHVALEEEEEAVAKWLKGLRLVFYLWEFSRALRECESRWMSKHYASYLGVLIWINGRGVKEMGVKPFFLLSGIFINKDRTLSTGSKWEQRDRK